MMSEIEESWKRDKKLLGLIVVLFLGGLFFPYLQPYFFAALLVVNFALLFRLYCPEWFCRNLFGHEWRQYLEVCCDKYM
jgi:hypothetical protein